MASKRIDVPSLGVVIVAYEDIKTSHGKTGMLRIVDVRSVDGRDLTSEDRAAVEAAFYGRPA